MRLCKHRIILSTVSEAIRVAAGPKLRKSIFSLQINSNFEVNRTQLYQRILFSRSRCRMAIGHMEFNELCSTPTSCKVVKSTIVKYKLHTKSSLVLEKQADHCKQTDHCKQALLILNVWWDDNIFNKSYRLSLLHERNVFNQIQSNRLYR